MPSQALEPNSATLTVDAENQRVELQLSAGRPTCAYEDQVQWRTSDAALGADVTMGGALALGGYQLRERCADSTCEAASLGLTVGGLAYLAATLWLHRSSAPAIGWRPTTRPCDPAREPEGRAAAWVISPTTMIEAQPNDEEKSRYKVPIPIVDLPGAELALGATTVPIIRLFPEVGEFTARRRTELSLEVPEAARSLEHDPRAPISIAVVIHNRGAAPTWARPRVTAEKGMRSDAVAPAARRIAPRSAETFSLVLPLSEPPSPGALPVHVALDATTEHDQPPLAYEVRIADPSRRRLKYVGCHISDKRSRAAVADEPRADVLIARGMDVEVGIKIRNEGNEAASGLIAELVGTRPDVLVPSPSAPPPPTEVPAGGIGTLWTSLFVPRDFDNPFVHDVPLGLRVRVLDEKKNALLDEELPLRLGASCSSRSEEEVTLQPVPDHAK